LCDFHYRVEKLGLKNLSSDEQLLFESYLKKVEGYKSLKESLLKSSNKICIEFDYSQNRALPLLPISRVFYSRLLWLYIFNVYFYNFKSFMLHFLEGMSQKGPNSVCSFLHHVLHEIQYSHPLIVNSTELILFSDTTCSQNRCWTVLKFFYLLQSNLILK